MAYQDLSDEDKIKQAIEFVAIDQTIPTALAAWLIEVGLYDLIVGPGKEVYGNTSREPTTGK